MGFFSRGRRKYPVDLARIQSINRARGGDEWSPLDLGSKLFSWWDGTDPTTMFVGTQSATGDNPGDGEQFTSLLDKSPNGWILATDNSTNFMTYHSSGQAGVQYPTPGFSVRGSTYGNMAVTDGTAWTTADPAGGLWMAWYGDQTGDINMNTNRSSTGETGIEILWDVSLNRVEMVSGTKLAVAPHPFKQSIISTSDYPDGNLDAEADITCGFQHTGVSTGKAYAQRVGQSLYEEDMTLSNGPWVGAALEQNRDAYFPLQANTTNRMKHVVITQEQLTDDEVSALLAYLENNRG